MGGFYSPDQSGVITYDSGVHLPVLYMRTTDTPYRSWNLEEFFGVTKPATCTPTVYCESYSMQGMTGNRGSYIIPGAKYYIPGGTDEYADAVGKAQFVQPMYSYTASKTANGKFKLMLKSNLSFLVFNKVIINGTTFAPIAINGLTTEIDYDKVGDIDVHYTVNGVPMHTIYPGNTASIESVGADCEQLDAKVDGAVVTFAEEADFTVIDLTGRKVAAGHGVTVSLENLPAGTYIVRATGAYGSKITLKVAH